MTERPVPAVCVLDPDGDIVEHLRLSGAGRLHRGWACYHTDMWVTQVDGLELGVVGRVVGAAFAVLVTEQLAVNGAELVVSITSAGQLKALGEPPYFVLIDRAIRDEGTSVRHLPPATGAQLQPHLLEGLKVWDESIGPLARHVDVVCLAHITNSMATEGIDFEKGEANGAITSLRYAAAVARTLAN